MVWGKVRVATEGGRAAFGAGGGEERGGESWRVQLAHADPLSATLRTKGARWTTATTPHAIGDARHLERGIGAGRESSPFSRASRPSFLRPCALAEKKSVGAAGNQRVARARDGGTAGPVVHAALARQLAAGSVGRAGPLRRPCAPPLASLAPRDARVFGLRAERQGGRGGRAQPCLSMARRRRRRQQRQRRASGPRRRRTSPAPARRRRGARSAQPSAGRPLLRPCGGGGASVRRRRPRDAISARATGPSLLVAPGKQEA